MDFDKLQEGDLVRALITDEGLSDHKREHCFILIGAPQPKHKGKKRHRICIPACSFSSSFPLKEDEQYIDIAKYSIPPTLFNQQKENTILRIAKPKCIEKYQYRGFTLNLKSFPEFWVEICSKVHSFYTGELQILNNTCDCECFKESEIESGFCDQDIDFLQDKYCKCEPSMTCKICSCCGYLFDNLEQSFEICPKCHDNLYVEILNGVNSPMYFQPDQDF